ncbi:ISNCY family transposase, partial [Pseudoalteromonas sp. S3776]
MRKIQPKQLQLGEIDIASIKLDTRSRDDVPQILLGLQYLYTNIKARELIFSLLEE